MAGPLYVACWLTPSQAARVAVQGGEPPEALHMTLCCVGDPAGIPGGRVTVDQIVARWAAATAPIAGTVCGTGRFAGGDRDCFYASIDSPQLADARQQLWEMLKGAGVEPDDTHGFTPHVTLTYLERGRPAPNVQPSHPITFRSVTVTSPDESTHVDVALGDTSGVASIRKHAFPILVISKDSPTTSAVHVNRPLGSDQATRQEEDDEKLDDIDVTILKADDEQRIVYGIVLEPDVEDSQGDVVSKADVELAAHRFLYGQVPLGDQHQRLAPASVRPVESFIAPCDFELGGQTVTKGSWVLAAHVPDDDLWSQVKKGEKGAWSVAGSGHRTPL